MKVIIFIARIITYGAVWFGTLMLLVYFPWPHWFLYMMATFISAPIACFAFGKQ